MNLLFLDESGKLNTGSENGIEVTFLYQSHSQGCVFNLMECYLIYCNAAMMSSHSQLCQIMVTGAIRLLFNSNVPSTEVSIYAKAHRRLYYNSPLILVIDI